MPSAMGGGHRVLFTHPSMRSLGTVWLPDCDPATSLPLRALPLRSQLHVNGTGRNSLHARQMDMQQERLRQRTRHSAAAVAMVTCSVQ
jgi:hypothetical protein